MWNPFSLKIDAENNRLLYSGLNSHYEKFYISKHNIVPHKNALESHKKYFKNTK